MAHHTPILTIYKLSYSVSDICIRSNIGWILSSKLNKGYYQVYGITFKRENPTSSATPVNPVAVAADSATDLPPGTLPVKDTKSTEGC